MSMQHRPRSRICWYLTQHEYRTRCAMMLDRIYNGRGPFLSLPSSSVLHQSLDARGIVNMEVRAPVSDAMMMVLRLSSAARLCRVGLWPRRRSSVRPGILDA